LPLQLLLDTLDVHDHVRVSRIGVIGHAIERPEGCLVVDFMVGAGSFPVVVGNFGNARIRREPDRGVGVINTEPAQAAHGIRQPVAHLVDEREAGLLGGRGALVEVALAVDLPPHRTPAVR